jgi:hypothetical protein
LFPAAEKYGRPRGTARAAAVGDRTVLEDRLDEVNDVVDDDVRPRTPRCDRSSVGERRLAAVAVV